MAGDIRQVRLPDGTMVPALGQGTWYMGEKSHGRASEVAALRRGLDLGMALIDTAEMYGEGTAEEIVGEAIAGRREDVFLVSKVLPYNASRKDTIKACEGSLRRLKTERIDLYLLHWRGSVPLSETLAAFHDLSQAGKIGLWGVSNFDVSDLEEWASLAGGDALATDQVLYNLSRRGIEFDLLPWCRNRNIPIMAYSPIEQGRLLGHPTLKSIAERHGATEAQIALAWVLRHPDMIAIPKASRQSHVEENRAAVDIALSSGDLAALDTAFPPPRRKKPLEML
jgi:diketogulonate reductase-like aldo/keto reductase